jgi:hypothetical protein
MDISVQDEGAICILQPVTDEGREWLDAHVEQSAGRWCGGIVCGHSYVALIVEGASRDGLVIEFA